MTFFYLINSYILVKISKKVCNMENLTKYRALHIETAVSQYGERKIIKANGNKIPTLLTDSEGFAQWIVKGLVFSKKTNFIRGSKLFTDLV